MGRAAVSAVTAEEGHGDSFSAVIDGSCCGDGSGYVDGRRNDATRNACAD